MSWVLNETLEALASERERLKKEVAAQPHGSLLHSAGDLADLTAQLRVERVLVGRLQDEDGLAMTAFVPIGRVQIILTDGELT